MHVDKGYKGMGMEGRIAAWYPNTHRHPTPPAHRDPPLRLSILK